MTEALAEVTGIMVIGAYGEVLQANVQVASMLGTTTRELIGQQVTDPVDGEVVRLKVHKTSGEVVSVVAHCSEIDHSGAKAFMLMLPEQPLMLVGTASL